MRRAFAIIAAALALAAAPMHGRPGLAGREQHPNVKTLLDLPFTSNGALLTPTAQTDLWLVADDVTPGSSWSAHGGTSYSATATGSVTLNETPLYPGGGFAGVGYRKAITGDLTHAYTLPSNAAYYLKSNTDQTWEVVYRSAPDFTTAADLLGGRVDAGGSALGGFEIGVENNDAGEQFQIAAMNNAGGVYLNFKPTSTGAALAFNMLTLVWDHAATKITAYLNGVSIGTSLAGSGTLNDTFAAPMGVMARLRNGGSFDIASRSALIEVMRHNGIAFSATQVAQRFYAMVGVQDAKGTYPTSFTRTASTTATVNGKSWTYGPNWPRIDSAGLIVSSGEALVFPSSVYGASSGSVTSTITPDQVASAETFVAGTSGYIIKQNAGTSWGANDSTNTVLALVAPIAGTPALIKTSWGPAVLSIADGVTSATGSFDGSMGSGALTIAGSGHIQNLVIKSK